MNGHHRERLLAGSVRRTMICTQATSYQGFLPPPNHMATSTNTPSFSGLVSSLPIADRDILAGLGDDDIRALWSAAKADDHRRLALTLLSIYNAVAPIHRLPFEVLSSIFEMCWKDRKSLRIGHVCRQWRSVLLDTSGFWASAVKREQFHQDDCATGYLGAVLERSAPQVIAPSFQHFSERVSPFLALHADRIASLTVSLGRCTELFHLWSCLNTGMRSLSTLKISSVNDDWWDVESRIADEHRGFEYGTLYDNAI
ncbi:hypothetical protein GSI_04634 [Ganoderma sinense ZZ0214-1]|uniref:F-box domain-containing protein n=1 Tax=Ganoderma sinense ZZ0214-1 TaxID=1077348 RepID=A0A2G8SHD3_9APHY|nr:hypothetical protein GSI_04634 [Ganoderma sinense ZZ0214-1]